MKQKSEWYHIAENEIIMAECVECGMTFDTDEEIGNCEECGSNEIIYETGNEGMDCDLCGDMFDFEERATYYFGNNKDAHDRICVECYEKIDSEDE